MHRARILGEIAACPLFSNLDPEERDDLATRTQTRTLEAKELLFCQGDVASSVYLCADGQLRLSKLTPEGEQVIVAVITPGQLFAVVAAMRTTTYPVTAEAVVSSRVLAWSRETMAPVLQRHPEIVFQAMEVVSTRMRELQDRYHELATLPVAQRLARALLRLVDQCGRATDGGIVLEAKLSRQDLAEMIGATLYTVSRILSGWDTDGVVAAGRESIVVLELDALRARAEAPPRHP